MVTQPLKPVRPVVMQDGADIKVMDVLVQPTGLEQSR